MGVVLKRALYFLTCNGRMMYQTKLEEDYIMRNLSIQRRICLIFRPWDDVSAVIAVRRSEFYGKESEGLRMKQIYICSDTITGMFSAFYDAWKERRNEEVGIRLRGNIEQELFCEYTEVQENERKATAIEKLIQNHMGDSVYHDIYHALLSEHAAKAETVFRVMQASRMIKDSRKIMEHLSDPDVAKVFELSRNVGNEVHRFLEFIRFRELENGVLYSEINPKNRVLTCMGVLFCRSFST